MTSQEFDVVEILGLVKHLLKYVDTKSPYNLQPVIEQLDRILPPEDKLAKKNRPKVMLSPIIEVVLKMLVSANQTQKRRIR